MNMERLTGLWGMLKSIPANGKEKLRRRPGGFKLRIDPDRTGVISFLFFKSPITWCPVGDGITINTQSGHKVLDCVLTPEGLVAVDQNSTRSYFVRVA